MGEDPSSVGGVGVDDDEGAVPKGLGCVQRDDVSSDSEATVTSTAVDPGFDAVIPTGEPVSRVMVSAVRIVGESVTVLDPEEID